MFTLLAFVILTVALLGGVWWACRNDSEAQ